MTVIGVRGVAIQIQKILLKADILNASVVETNTTLELFIIIKFVVFNILVESAHVAAIQDGVTKFLTFIIFIRIKKVNLLELINFGHGKK